MMYNPPVKPLRSFAADYPAGGTADATGRLTTDIEGRPLGAQYIVGRQYAGLPDVRLDAQDVAAAAQGSLGALPEAVEARALPRGTVGAFRRIAGPDGPQYNIGVLRTLEPQKFERVTAHEFGHAIDTLAGTIDASGLNTELRTVYNDLNNSQSYGKRFGPEQSGYRGADVGRELMAEALRAYMADPNYLKTVAPKTAARIRAAVNSNPMLRDLIQFNSIAAPVAIGSLWPDEKER